MEDNAAGLSVTFRGTVVSEEIVFYARKRSRALPELRGVTELRISRPSAHRSIAVPLMGNLNGRQVGARAEDDDPLLAVRMRST